MMIDGTACAAVTVKYLPGVGNAPATPIDLRNGIEDVSRAVAGGDYSVLERMLLQQAAGLQAVFADLAFKARAQTSRENHHSLTSLALKAAAGSRQAITALGDLRMPKQVLFAKQANVVQAGAQQVVNGAPVATAATSRRDIAREAVRQDPQNELLEAGMEGVAPNARTSRRRKVLAER